MKMLTALLYKVSESYILMNQHVVHNSSYLPTYLFFFIWFVRLLALRPLLAYCASLG
jgi:hypothetical protein